MAACNAVVAHVRPQRAFVPAVYHGVRLLFDSYVQAGYGTFAGRDELAAGDLEWIETPSNPMCSITDVTARSAENAERGVITVVDSTFATPILLHPLALGADMVVHSATKAIGGHSDTHAGVIVVNDTLVADDLRHQREFTGAVPGSFDVWLALRGIRTLPLRVQRATSSAGAIAEWTHQQGITTYYPGLPSHDGHDIARREMSGFGSMLAIDVGSAERARQVVTKVNIFTNATSLGGVESLVEHRVVSDPTQDPGLIRISVGLEDLGDLIADLAQAL
jgi:cystathionine gamma-synthase